MRLRTFRSNLMLFDGGTVKPWQASPTNSLIGPRLALPTRSESISLHCVAGEDLFVQQLIREKLTLWETQNWGEKIGVPVAPGGPMGWEEARQANLNLAAIMEFEEAVCEETLIYLNSLTPEALDRPVSFFGSERPVAFLLAIIIFHSFEHLGEISALKGVQGIIRAVQLGFGQSERLERCAHG